MLEKFLNIFRIPDLRKRVLFTLGILAVYRLGAFIPTPGIDTNKLALLFSDRYVVQLVEVGWNADPPYYVMEYLERGSLEERLQRGPMPVPDAVSLFREVAVALVHAHGKGILHCDLKPANVLLDQDWKPRLADFGQSRLSHEQTFQTPRD